MNIAIDSRILVSNFRGGILVYTERLVEHLLQLDRTNNYHLLFSGLRLSPEQIQVASGPNCRKAILPIPDREFPGKSFLWKELLVPLYCAAKRIDVYHLPAFHELTRLARVKRVITIHDLRSRHITDGPDRQDLGALEASSRLADHVITVSDFTRDDLISSFGVPPDRVTTVPLGVDPEFRVVDDEEALASLRERLGLRRPFFLALGLVPRKNIEGTLRAYASFRHRAELDLVLAGHLGGPWIQRYRGLIDELGLRDSVILPGAVSIEDLVLLYNSARAFVFPSLLEGFGLPVLEAMACGAPVITSNLSALPEVAGDAALLVDPHDHGAICAALERLAEDDQLAADLSRRGLARAREYSWERMARSILEIYQRL